LNNTTQLWDNVYTGINHQIYLHTQFTINDKVYHYAHKHLRWNRTLLRHKRALLYTYIEIAIRKGENYENI